MEFWQGPMGKLEMSKNLPNAKFWQGKRVLVTGNTGFKGAWLIIWLNKLGAETYGIGLDPVSQPNLFDLADVGAIGWNKICDIRDAEKVKTNINILETTVTSIIPGPCSAESFIK